MVPVTEGEEVGRSVGPKHTSWRCTELKVGVGISAQAAQ